MVFAKLTENLKIIISSDVHQSIGIQDIMSDENYEENGQFTVALVIIFLFIYIYFE